MTWCASQTTKETLSSKSFPAGFFTVSIYKNKQEFYNYNEKLLVDAINLGTNLY